ncbi:hypothetical protein C0992_010927, partial [Termitomyces sp. T32_za158]
MYSPRICSSDIDPSHLKAAETVFNQAGKNQTHSVLDALSTANAPPEEVEAVYAPLFKSLSTAIVGRDDIPLPPGRSYSLHFRYLCDPSSATLLGHDMVQMLMKSVIRY